MTVVSDVATQITKCQDLADTSKTIKCYVEVLGKYRTCTQPDLQQSKFNVGVLPGKEFGEEQYVDLGISVATGVITGEQTSI
jgi:hypothetical protein